jgi:two-component system nitrogen regulation response regulator GlnG/two-component system response regulator HydG
MRERPGLIGEAHGTTLFLDEIGEAPHAMQAHLLRLLDGGEYHRLGESAARRAQLFVVGATNRELGELKHDFVARFTVRLIVPSLQERREDIPLVLAHLVRTAAARSPALARFCDGDGQLRAEAQLIEALLRHAFALNVRELEEILLRAAAASAGDTLSAIDLAPPDARRSSLPPPPPPRLPSPDEVAAAMLRNGGNRSHAWRELGLRNRYVLYRLLRKGGASGAARAARGHRGTGAAPRE